MRSDKVLVIDVNPVHVDENGNVDESKVTFGQKERDVVSLSPFEQQLIQRAYMMSEAKPVLVRVWEAICEALGRKRPASEVQRIETSAHSTASVEVQGDHRIAF